MISSSSPPVHSLWISIWLLISSSPLLLMFPFLFFYIMQRPFGDDRYLKVNYNCVFFGLVFYKGISALVVQLLLFIQLLYFHFCYYLLCYYLFNYFSLNELYFFYIFHLFYENVSQPDKPIFKKSLILTNLI